METIGKLGHILGETWYGTVICVVATLVVVYLNIRKIGGLELTFEERQEKVKAFAKTLRVIILVLGTLGFVGLLKPIPGLAIVMTLSISEALIGLATLKMQEVKNLYDQEEVEEQHKHQREENR